MNTPPLILHTKKNNKGVWLHALIAGFLGKPAKKSSESKMEGFYFTIMTGGYEDNVTSDEFVEQIISYNEDIQIACEHHIHNVNECIECISACRFYYTEDRNIDSVYSQ